MRGAIVLSSIYFSKLGPCTIIFHPAVPRSVTASTSCSPVAGRSPRDKVNRQMVQVELRLRAAKAEDAWTDPMEAGR